MSVFSAPAYEDRKERKESMDKMKKLDSMEKDDIDNNPRIIFFYTIYDELVNHCSPVFEALNNLAAKRLFTEYILSLSNSSRRYYSLYRIASFDKKTMVFYETEKELLIKGEEINE